MFCLQMKILMCNKSSLAENLKQKDQVLVHLLDLLSSTENLMEPHLQNCHELQKLGTKEYLLHHG